MDDIADLYEDIREDHYDGLTDKKYLTLEQARSKAFKTDWSNFTPIRPSFLGDR